jgi:hypothetical protein
MPVSIPDGCLQVLLEIQALDDEQSRRRVPVKYKEDGARFGSESITLKLSAGHQYALTLVISPPSIVANAAMQCHGSTAPVEADVDPESSSRQAEGASIHSYTWQCDLEVNKNNTRHKPFLCFDVEDLGSVSLPMQLKVYGDNLRGFEHVRQGFQSLLHLQYLLKRKSDRVALVGKVTAFGAFDRPEEGKDGARGGVFYLS